MEKHVAVYMRVSTDKQRTASQERELKQWTKAQDTPVDYYTDTGTGKNMQRPEWEKLIAAVRRGRVSTIVCWSIDRLGRTASGLTALFDELREHNVNLISLKENIDLDTPAGRFMATVIAGMAAWETEQRSERVKAGQAAARAAGKTWGGSEAGVRKKVTDKQIADIHRLAAKGESKVMIARATGLCRSTIYDVLKTEAVPA